MVAAAPVTTAGSLGAFTFEDVRRLAQERVRQPYRPPSEVLPEALNNLTFEQYRNIRYRAGSSLWRGQALFEVEFFHRGYHNRQRVNIFDVSSAGVTPIAYNASYFSFGNLAKVPKAPASLGYAGFRVHFPLQTPTYKDELLTFLGASYFRALARNQHYGASARGLAVDTAAPSGEDFPTSRTFGSCARGLPSGS